MSKKERILVVDDDPANLELTVHVLKAAGYEVDTATTGQEAIGALDGAKPALILLDVVLPDINGIDLCRRIKTTPGLSDVFVVLFSGWKTESEIQAEGLEAGADGYITRSVTNRELLARVHAMLRIRNAEERLRQSREEVVGILDSISDGFFALDNDMAVTYFNKAAERLTGRPSQAVVGRKLFEVFPEIQGSVFEEKYVWAMRERRALSFETYFAAGLNAEWYDVRVFPHENGLTVYFRITTEHKKSEARLKAAIDEIAQYNRQLQQYAYAVSHDLQEPLGTILSHLGSLELECAEQLDAEARKHIESAAEGSKRLKKMIGDLLTYSRIDTEGGPAKPVNAKVAVDRALANLKVAIETGNATVTCEPLPVVSADGTQLVQVFQNLIGNAIKFRGKEPPRIHVSAEARNGNCVFAVRDNGMGIEPQYLDRIFDVFQRLDTSPENPGTGIGLAVCKKIVERHGGKMWVESAPGKGSAFFFSIPAGR